MTDLPKRSYIVIWINLPEKILSVILFIEERVITVLIELPGKGMRGRMAVLDLIVKKPFEYAVLATYF